MALLSAKRGFLVTLPSQATPTLILPRPRRMVVERAIGVETAMKSKTCPTTSTMHAVAATLRPTSLRTSRPNSRPSRPSPSSRKSFMAPSARSSRSRAPPPAPTRALMRKITTGSCKTRIDLGFMAQSRREAYRCLTV